MAVFVLLAKVYPKLVSLCGATLLAVVIAYFAPAHADIPRHRVLIVYEADAGQAATAEVSAGFRRRLDREHPVRFDVYSEYLDSVRFPGDANLDRMAHQMTQKYADTRFDAVIALGPTAVEYLLKNRNTIAAGVPMFFGGITDATAAKLARFPDVKGVISRFDVKQTIALARQLQPSSKEAVVITGSAPFDKSWEKTAREELGENYLGFRMRYVTDLTLAGFEQEVAKLSSETAVLVLTVYEDANGEKFVPRDAASEIAAQSAAPVYSVYDTFVGRGVLGGYMGTFQDVGEQLAGLVAMQVAGRGDVPKATPSVARPVVDWRQMMRFGFKLNLLPENTEVRFETPSLWSRYRTEILLTAFVLILQSATIIALIAQGHRRRVAEAEAETGRSEVAHLSRTSMLGELSGAFAHELNQPLTSILANAQVAKQMVKSGTVETVELLEILSDIEADNARAGAVIAQLRHLFTKGEAVLEPADLNQIGAATMKLVKSDLLTRQTNVEFKRSREAVPVLGNYSQLQQIVINIIFNAIDATSHLQPSERSIEMTIRKNGKTGEIAVSDNGKGLTQEMMSNAFKPFVSTKPKGLGIGLSICRSIARAHGGSLNFDDGWRSGARIVLSLPLEGRPNGEDTFSSASN